MFFNNNFILASTSLSRYKILKNNKLKFIRIKPNCDEVGVKKKLIKNNKTPQKISLELARLKSQSVSIKKNEDLVVGCDTVICLNGTLLNKAKNIKEAKKKIIKLSGKHHYIYSSASVFYNEKEVWNSTQKSRIKIRNLTENEIDKYLLVVGKQILSCVGCYQVESLGPNIIEDTRGDFFNIMGFPLFPFLRFLKKHKRKTT